MIGLSNADDNAATRQARLPGYRVAAAVLLMLLAGPIASSAVPPTQAIQAQGEIPEDSLLDVGIQILDPGMPEGDPYSLEADGYFSDVRKSEARYIPVSLMETMQATGNWGAVRVIPAGNDHTDLVVKGRINESSGRKLVLALQAVDATGRVWLEKNYKHVADAAAYHEDQLARDPFQDLFNRIANDLLAARDKLDDDELRRVRQIAQVKFAADLAPEAYGDYLGRNRRGRVVLEKLPADGDPVLERVTRIRHRDDLFVDTLTEYYANFHAQMSEPYDNWRKFSYEEEVARRKLKRQARTQQILGALGILGGLLMEGNSRESSAVRQVGVVAGSMAIQSGMAKAQEAKLHVEALRELASSFDSEVAPLLVDVEGQTMRLSGSIETQYITWRQLMRDFFVSETGFPLHPDTGQQVAVEVPDAPQDPAVRDDEIRN
ncbi:MAG: hypothetical protein AAF560_03650 [Acidobacteriota bacterium]